MSRHWCGRARINLRFRRQRHGSTQSRGRPRPARDRVRVGPVAGRALDETWKASNKEEAAGVSPDSTRRLGPLPRLQPLRRRSVGTVGRRSFDAQPVKATRSSPLRTACRRGCGRSRVYLEMDELAPEVAARVSVNGQDAGGFIGAPLRLLVTPASNRPKRDSHRALCPPAARLTVYPSVAETPANGGR